MPIARGRGARRLIGALAITAAGVPLSGCDGPVPQRPPQKPEFLKVAQDVLRSPNTFQGRGRVDALVTKVRDPATPGPQRVVARSHLASEHLRLGDVEAAIEQIDGALVEARRPAPGLYRLRALAHLRQAEVRNCVARHNAECCIFPLQDRATHQDRGPALAARDDYLTYLQMMPPIAGDAERDRDILTATWLLNITCMALDEYPEGVPEPYRIPPSVFESDYDIGRFVDVAPRIGLDAVDLAGGAIVDDFDGDGLLDLVTSTSDVKGPMKAFRNAGDGTFEDRSAAWRLDDQLGGLNIIGADYDNDGDPDILVPRGAWLLEEGRIRNSLLRNDGPDGFTDVTRAAGLVEPMAPTQAAVWADLDNDGWLDLYVCNESRPAYASNLFRNRGDGTFDDVARAAGATNDRYCKGVAAGDYDDDGDMDLYVSNIGRNRLYRNDGGLRFTDVAQELGVTAPEDRSFASWFFDYDNDGDLDLWVNPYEADAADVAAGYVRGEVAAEPVRLYRNNGDGTFDDVALEMGLTRAVLPMGSGFGDFDNDGWLDVYLGTGDPDFEALMPNIALRNDGGRRFQDVTQSGGLGHLQKGHGTVFADVDNDGDQDLFLQLGGFYPADGFANALFRNPGHGNHFLTIELVGVESNRAGVGARVRVVLDTPAGIRELHRAAGSVSSFGGSPRRLEIGLGDARSIGAVEVWWPASGVSQSFAGAPLDGFIRIIEDRQEFETLSPQRFALGG